MPITPPVAHARAIVGARARHCEPTDPALADARRNLRAALLADHIRRVVDTFPPLSDDQKADLIRLFGTGRR